MQTNFSLLIYLKKRKEFTGTTAPIYARITVEGRRAEMATGRHCEPGKWNAQAGRANGSKEEIRTLNAFLDGFQARLYAAHKFLADQDFSFTAEDLKKKMLGKDKLGERHMIAQVYENHNKKVEILVGKEFAASTLQRYQISLMHTRAFILSYYKLKDIDVRKVDNVFITEFDFYLRSVRGCNNNSTVKYLKNFGKIIRICLANGWIIKNPFLHYNAKVKTVERQFLTAVELANISGKDFHETRLEQVRDVFVFSCYTGLAYADVKKLKTDQIQSGLDGNPWIFTKRQKTDTRSAIPLLPAAVKLIEKYSNHPYRLHKGYPLPVPSNQKMNDYLKEIATMCEINKNLTFHIARHTFATTVTLSNGVPIETVSKMLGHSSLKQTQHYAKILDIKVSKDMQELRSKILSSR